MIAIMLVLLLRLCMPLHAQTVTDTTLIMSDGTRIDALYVLPTVSPPPGGYPAILLVHGYAGSKNNNRSLALTYARAGYAATAYSVRGQGASEGLFSFFGSPRILDDLRENLAFTRQLRGVDPSRVAVVGGSQGGLHAWNAAVHAMGVRCVVSMIANGRYEENWLENDALNWTFAAATMTNGVRMDPGISTILRQARESGVFSSLRPFLRNQSTHTLESSVTVPTAIIVSYHDGFFNQNAALRQFASIPAAKRIILYPGAHDLPPDPAQNGYVLDFIDRWLRYWLRDETDLAAVASPDSAVVYFDGASGAKRIYSADMEEEWLRPSNPLPATLRRVDLYFDAGGLSFSPPASRSERLIPYINVLGSTPLSFRTQPLESDMIILPPPGEGHLRVLATGASYQMNVLLYDVNPSTGRRTPLCRGHRMAADPNSERTMEFELTSILHTVREGHVIEALVNSGVALIPDRATTFGNFVLGSVNPSLNTFILGGDVPSRVTLYVANSGTAFAEVVPVDPQLRIFPAWPNPADASSIISFELREESSIRLTLHDAMGREVLTHAEARRTRGAHSVRVLTSDLQIGIYYYRIVAGDAAAWGRLAVLR